MRNRAERDLTKLADAAFAQAARKVIARAVASGTPVIVWVKGEVKAIPPHAIKLGSMRARRKRSVRRRGA
jgi:hypothetical protein